MIVFGECGRIVEIRDHGAIWAWAYGPRKVWTLATRDRVRELPTKLVQEAFPELSDWLATQ